MKATVSFKGINRSSDLGISPDGQCMELINAKVSNGSIIPVGKPILEHGNFYGTPEFIHVNNDYEHVISIITSGTTSIIYDCDRPSYDTSHRHTIVSGIVGFKKIESVGNLLVIIAEKTSYALYTPSSHSYSYLGEKPSFPYINFSYESQPATNKSFGCTLLDKVYVGNPSTNTTIALNSSSTRNEQFVSDTLNGAMAKTSSENSDSGYFSWPVLVRYAIRLYDGSYIMHSAPCLIMLAGKNERHIQVTSTSYDGDSLSSFTFNVFTTAYKLKYSIFANANLEPWKDLIQSVDVYITKQIQTVDLNKNIASFEVKGGARNSIYFYPNWYSDSSMIDQIAAQSVFYKVKSFSLTDIAQGNTGYITDSSLLKNIEQNETLPDDAFTHNSISGNVSYVYNSRLHLGDITSTLYDGYAFTQFINPSPLYWIDSTAFTQLTLYARATVYINTDSGEKVVTCPQQALSTYGILPYLSYPDSRAKKMIVQFQSGSTYYTRTFNLKPHPYLNLAYSLEQLKPYVPADFNTQSNFVTYATDNKEISPNKLKVSALNNPTYFPAVQTYVPSNGRIKALRSATAALSSGQFGQFPLYVFTEEGVHALSVGQSTVYSNSSPVTRDVCSNTKSICSTDNAVVFATQSSLMLIYGAQTKNISEDIEGYLPTTPSSSPVLGQIATVAGMENVFSSSEFHIYLKDAVVGFCYEDKEVIVSNPSYKYSYVYNLTSGQWHKIYLWKNINDVVISKFLNSYPESLALFSDGGIYNMFNNRWTINNVLILTRPIKLGTNTPKRVTQTALRGVMRPSASNVYYEGNQVKYAGEDVTIFSRAGFYVLGSKDGDHFTVLSGAENLSDIRDMITKMNKTNAYKYFMVALSGGVRTDVAFNYIELMVDEAFNNRLR